MKGPVSSRYAARAVGISLMTLQRWIADGDIRPPKLQIVNGRATRLWDGEDVERSARAGEMTSNFVDEKGAGKAARLKGVGDGDVVGDDDALDFVA